MLYEEIHKLTIGRTRIAARITVDDGDRISLCQGTKQLFPPLNHRGHRRCVSGVYKLVAVEEMSVLKSRFPSFLIVGNNVWAQGQHHTHAKFTMQHGNDL